MKPDYKRILDLNFQMLKEDLEIVPVTDYCFAKGVINVDDLRRIEAEKAHPDMVVKFINILKTKPDKAYNKFLDALESPGVKQAFIRKNLEKTDIPEESTSDCYIEELLQQVIMECFTVEKGSKCSKRDIIETVRMRMYFKHKKPLTLKADQVFGVIRIVYPESETRKDSSKCVVAVENISLRFQEDEPVDDVLERDGGSCKILDPTPLEKVTPEAVAAALRIHLEGRNLDVRLAARMVEHDIDGQALFDIQDNPALLEKIFSDLPIGRQAKVLGAVKVTLEELKTPRQTSTKRISPVQSSQRKMERYREFDTKPKSTDVYVQGFVLSEEQPHSTSLVEPIHRYSIVEDEDACTLAEETVRFATACLNERTNGTIHFGVRSRFESKENPGVILGIRMNKRETGTAISEAIYQAFYDDQRELAMMCIREPHCIPVITQEATASNELFVIEVDVVPQYQIIKNEAFFLKPSTGERAELLRYIDGMATAIDGKDLVDFMSTKSRLEKMRKTNEKKCRGIPPNNTDLHRKLQMFLSGGNDYSMTDVYPVVFLSPCCAKFAGEKFVDNFRFIKSLDPFAVFDFDPAKQDVDGRPRGLCTAIEEHFGQVHKTLTTDNFDRNSEENKSCEHGDGVSRLFDDIDNSASRTWIFCNGFEPLCEEMEPAVWRRKRGQGFKEAVRFYDSRIPSGQAKILIFLLSENYEVLFGALEEIIVKFPEQWMIIAESEDIANEIVSEILHRKYVEKGELKKRCIIGMPWSHVNHSIMNICGHSGFTECVLPSSTGTPVLLKERKKNEWTDLELLSMRQCCDEAEEFEREGRQDDIEDKDRETEYEFYRGNQLSWWNFYFMTHVLERQQTRELKQKVVDLLNGTTAEDDKVGLVSLFHQPGAGGTTIARHVLWDLKSTFRCCEVKEITDQTCDQISNFRGFEEQYDAKPVVVLIDSADFERVCQLRSQLTERARREARDGKSAPKLFCVFIICRRVTTSKKKWKVIQPDKTTVVVDHELPQDALEWFRKKYKELETRHDSSDQWRHPKLLISFNIMKENFNPDYIRHTVHEFINEIDDREKRLLRFVSLINTYDVEFKKLPISAFNPIMCPSNTMKSERQSLGSKQFSRGPGYWEANLSKPLNVLLNRTSTRCCGKDIKTVRIINSCLSKVILNDFRNRNKGSPLHVSDVILELLHSDICKKSSESVMQDQFIKIIKSVLRMRAATDKGRNKFSLIILAIGEAEGYQHAALVLETGFEVFYDPMLAQQVARVYLHLQHWNEAEKFARQAMDIERGNSYFCDTYGQVYKQKLVAMWNEFVQQEQFEDQKMKEAVDVAFSAIDIFREAQMLTEKDVSSDYNNCGFFSELRVIATLLDICRFFQPFKSDQGQTNLHKFLVNKSYVPPQLKGQLGSENIDRIKNLHREYEKPLRRLEDELIQLKEDPCYQDSVSYTRSIEDFKALVKLKVKLLLHFGEDTDEIPRNLSNEEACEFRRRRVKQRGGTSLHSVLDLCKDEADGVRTIESVYAMTIQNLKSGNASADDLRILLNLTVASFTLDRTVSEMVSMEQILEWTKQLYEMTKSQEAPYLETFLYFVMFHWPTDWRKQQTLPLCACSKIKEVIGKWKQVFLDIHPAQSGERKKPDRRKPVTLFFLGQGEGFAEIAYGKFPHFPGESIWETAEVKRRLKRLNGTLRYGGMSLNVSISSSDGSTACLDIPTSMPIRDQLLWNKHVHFYLGFCWSGPKAYAVVPFDAEKLSSVQAQAVGALATLPSAESLPVQSPRNSYAKMILEETKLWQDLSAIRTQIGEVEKKLRLFTNKKMNKDLEKKKQALERNRDALIHRSKHVLQGTD